MRPKWDPVGLDADATLRDVSLVYEWTELESMARELVEETGWTEAWDAYELLRKLDYRVGEALLPPGIQAIRLPGSRVIVVARGLRAAARLYAILHEIAHDLVPRDASHADVYAVSLALAHTPQQVDAVRIRCAAEPTPQDIYDGTTPPWCAVLRCRIGNP